MLVVNILEIFDELVFLFPLCIFSCSTGDVIFVNGLEAYVFALR